MVARALQLPFEEGTLLAGKYRVGAVIAGGGMGVVAEGLHEVLEQRVAIKFLKAESVLHPEATERFLREARAAAKIRSDHVVRVLDVGSHEDIPYMVMEFLEGEDLGDVLHREGALPVGEAVSYVVDALEALAEAHEMGIVHRDLKPSNLFRTASGGGYRVKVLDFGISKLARTPFEERSLTNTRSILGSPGYMSPEQVRSSRSVDARTDVWSIGVILYELLTGKPAYTGEGLGDVFAKIREEPLPSIREVRPDVGEALGAVIDRCLERNRELRYADAGALRAALLPFAEHGAESTPQRGRRDAARAHAANADTLPAAVALGASPKPLSKDGTEGERERTASTWSGAAERPARSRFLVAGTALAVVVGAGWFASRGAPAPAADRRVQETNISVSVAPPGSVARPVRSGGADGASEVGAGSVWPADAPVAEPKEGRVAKDPKKPKALGPPSAATSAASSAPPPQPHPPSAAPPPPPATSKPDDLGI